jgi:hypothetical protein
VQPKLADAGEQLAHELANGTKAFEMAVSGSAYEDEVLSSRGMSRQNFDIFMRVSLHQFKCFNSVDKK